jgi:hypothetical protein
VFSLIDASAHVIDFTKDCDNPRSLYLIDKYRDFPVEVKVGCNRRFDCMCLACARAWRAKKFMKMTAGINQMERPRFLTLTQRYDTSKGYLDKSEIQALWKHRARLFEYLQKERFLVGPYLDRAGYTRVSPLVQHRPAYKITKWSAIIEFPNHIHLVYEGDYLPRAEIVDLWEHLTGSFVVDIRPVTGPREVAKYLSKYLSKASQIPKETIVDMKGVHLFQSFGLTRDDKEPFTVDYHGSIYGLHGWSRLYGRVDFEARVSQFSYFWNVDAEHNRPVPLAWWMDVHPRQTRLSPVPAYEVYRVNLDRQHGVFK